MGNFPEYVDHADARCFRCGGALRGEPRESGYREGRFVRNCVCGYATFYDLQRCPRCAGVLDADDGGEVYCTECGWPVPEVIRTSHEAGPRDGGL